MARIMISCAGKEAGDAAIMDFSDDMPIDLGLSIMFTEIAMARCPHTMKATLADGRAYCCDCGKILAARGEGG
jgi:hypothetical protein